MYSPLKIWNEYWVTITNWKKFINYSYILCWFRRDDHCLRCSGYLTSQLPSLLFRRRWTCPSFRCCSEATHSPDIPGTNPWFRCCSVATHSPDIPGTTPSFRCRSEATYSPDIPGISPLFRCWSEATHSPDILWTSPLFRCHFGHTHLLLPRSDRSNRLQAIRAH